METGGKTRLRPGHLYNCGMNPRLDLLQPYPFERLRQLFSTNPPASGVKPISLGIGEPQHPTPQFIKDAVTGNLSGLAGYPATAGSESLRRAIGGWLERRYGLPDIDPLAQVMPVNGSREALFALTQTVVDPTRAGATVVSPNPFYQIYEGAALLAGAAAHFVPVSAERNFACDYSKVPEAVWRNTQLLFVCSPGNPTGAVMNLEDWREVFGLADRYGFVIGSDECYSEIYFDEAHPPLGALEAARKLGRGCERLVMFSSLSKRSNVPGMRSGFVAGDPAIIKPFLLYRTYHGCAMSMTVQAASAAAWNDEDARQGKPPPVCGKICRRSARAARCPGSTPAGCGVLSVGKDSCAHPGRFGHRICAGTACHGKPSRFFPAVTSRAPSMVSTLVPVTSAWRWLPDLPNAWKRRNASRAFAPAF